ncbi:porin [Robbsia andropogonis]|uniref:porin n=1 Tax=Robbsia andropogonis TaxID=28092 RepID=UPI003D22F34F
MAALSLGGVGLHATVAHAASDDADGVAGVSLYGEIDAGIAYLHQPAGGASWRASQGLIDGSYWGVRGSEPLNGDLRALFRLEHGFSSTDGSLINDHPMYVGLASERFGMVTLGRQYDGMYDFLAPFTLTGNSGGTAFAHPFDNDNANNSYLASNAIKYTSPEIGGVTFGGMYAFSNASAGMSRNRAYSVGARFKAGDFQIGGAYLRVDGLGTTEGGAYDAQPLPLTPTMGNVVNYADASARRQNTFGIGASYTIGAFTSALSYSRAVYTGVADASDGSPAASIGFSNMEWNVSYQASTALQLTAMVSYTHASASSRWLTGGMQAIYTLSPRTNVYVQWVGQRASDGQLAVLNGFGPSNGRHQLLLATGVRHNF